MVMRHQPNPVLRSPVRVSLNNVWASDHPFDMRYWLQFDTCPIEVCRQYAADIRLGVYTLAFGEAAERAFCKSAFDYYSWRDKQAVVDLWMRNIQGVYVHTFYRDAGGAIVGLDICISPPLQAVALPAAYIAEALRAMRWALPWFAALSTTSPGPGLTVTACESEEASVSVTTGFYSRVVFDAVGAGS